MMKKILFASLFSATLLFGGSEISAFAQEIIPDDTTTPPIEVPTEPSTPEKPTDPTPPIEPPVDPVEPPITPTEPTEPTEPTTPTEPEKPVEPTEPTTPTEPITPTEPSEPEQPTEPSKPVEPEKPVTPSKPAEPEKPVTPSKPTEPEKPVQPAEPSKPIDVVVTPTGELNHAGNGTQQPTVPIETSNLAEITHVPSVTTPITTTDGENIVAVEKGVPLTQTAEGLKPIQSSYKVLPSGNVEVKGKDGKMKVLPYTGEEMNIFLSAVGGILSVVSGFVIFKKRKAKV